MSKNDKTEEATPKKKRDSRQKGQIAKSQDLTGWFGLLVGLYLLPMTVVRMAEVVSDAFHDMRAMPPSIDDEVIIGWVGTSLRDGFLAATPLLLAVTAASVAASLGQTGLVLSLKPLKPDFKKINPKNGFKRLFSVKSVWETVKQLMKMTVIIAISWPRIEELFDVLAGRGPLGLGEGLEAAGRATLGLVRTITWAVFLLMLFDYGYQRYQTRRDMRMTKQEVRDEYKNAEGDGSVKARMRQMARSMARNRMLADVGRADVIVTNPTHIAVAIRYDPERGGAPRVLATGAGSLAAKIRERAREESVPIVEAKPLARALWRACDVGDEVPVLLYEAVAKVLVFVRKLEGRLTTARVPIDLPRAASMPEEFLATIPRKKRRR